ncbi:MAG: response regulator [Proteobacteria bacterium]|nr:MAG: response regulator [Pseudomonadota bacterium]
MRRNRPRLSPFEAPSPLKILVVDDAPDNQQLLWRYLTKQGAIVETAENGLVGSRMALIGTYDIVLMDIQMPVMDGYSATAKLREAGYKTPIIALTAHAMTEVRRKALNVGYTDHLPKPINPKQLIAAVRNYTRKD